MNWQTKKLKVSNKLIIIITDEIKKYYLIT